MPERCAYDYAVVRVVPDVARGEYLNAGIILFAKSAGVLLAKVALDEARLRAFAPNADIEAIRGHLDAIVRTATGGPPAGPHASLNASERFHWLTSPRSTVIQTSPVHAGLCDDPTAEAEHLFARLVGGGPDSRDRRERSGP